MQNCTHNQDAERQITSAGPVKYYPEDNGEKFVDCLQGHTRKLLKERGLMCPCTNLVVYNFTSARQHFATRVHQNWLNQHTDKRGEILEEHSKLKEDRKNSLIREGLQRQHNARLEKINNDLNKEISDMQCKLDEVEEDKIAINEEINELKLKLKAKEVRLQQLQQLLQKSSEDKDKLERDMSNINNLKFVNQCLQKDHHCLQEEKNKILEKNQLFEELAIKILRESGYEIQTN